jgi:hypothetical protein
MKNIRHTLLAVSTLAVAAAFVLGLDAPLARAGIIFSGTTYDIVMSDPVDVGTTGILKAVTLTAVGKDGYHPNAFDGFVNGGTGITTATNKLFQIYQDGSLKTPTLTLDEDSDPIPLDMDTHFLITEGSYLAEKAPSETRGTLDTTEHLYGGYGNKLTGTFTLTGTPNDTWDFAYLVVPNLTTVNLNFVIAGNKSGATASDTVQRSFLVPEPGTFVLLALGLVGLVICRRRFAR